jgi:hypothetical protein
VFFATGEGDMSLDALDPRFSSKPPQAMLNILTFTNGHTFDLNGFVAGEMPPRDQVAVAPTLVSLS